MAAATALVAVLVPVLNLLVPEGSPLHLSDYAVALTAKIMCYAICALAMDLIWGYTGILSLGHGVFFALGGYAMGMYLMRQIGRDGNYQSDLPDFMVFLDWKTLPWHWALSDSFVAQLLLVLLVPGLLAFVFGFFAFRSRIKGVYFSIITQAMTFAAMLLFFRNETGFGGNNGFTDFKRIAGLPLNTPGMKVALCVSSGVALIGCDTANDVTGAGDHYPETTLPIHQVALVAMGLRLIDNADLERLGETCARKGRYDFMLSLNPLRLEHGTGSPANPIATF